MPLYRLEKGFVYDGVIISRQTMSNWFIKCVETYLVAIYLLLMTYLLKETFIHGDETTVQVLHEPGRPAQSKSYEWVYCSSRFSEHKVVIFEYQQTRKQDHPKKFLKDFKGFLHTDGYQVYHNLPDSITIVGFSTFRYAKCRAARVRPSCRCVLVACSSAVGEPL